MINNGKQLVYSEDKYQEWRKTLNNSKEVHGKPVRIAEKEYRIYNQWGYDSIDYFVYTFYKNRSIWDLDNLNITVVRDDGV